VRRRADARDGRRSYVRLSPKGLARFGEIHGRAHELEELLASRVGPGDLATATRALVQIRTYLEGFARTDRSRR